jgi:hypothetical protein
VGNRTAILRSKKSYETGSAAAPISAVFDLGFDELGGEALAGPSNEAQFVCSGICRDRS